MQDRRCFLPDVETTAMSACGSPVFPEAPPGGSVVLDFHKVGFLHLASRSGRSQGLRAFQVRLGG